ncbi:hypothetical protein ASE59_11595 [Sphingomonas sp. Leaf10]|nr:hypothetical protein ASE59_11595 [Sphingomonas sp. Leaf10]
MGPDGAHVRLKLDTREPIALTDFVAEFVGLGNQFEKFVATHHPELRAEGEFFVKDVREGCIEADLVAFVGSAYTATRLPGIIDAIDKGQILTTFVRDIANRLSPYLSGKRDEKASKADLADFHKTVGAIARDPDASALLEAAVFEDGERRVTSAFKFRTPEAREAERQISAHRQDLDAKLATDHERVLLKFVRPSVETGKPGRKSGERAIIEKVHPKPLAVVYASDLAEQRVRSEMMLLDGNIFRSLFDVDVNVELNAFGKPLAYRIVHVHAVIEEGDSDDDIG